MSDTDATQASQVTNYQDDVNADVDREYDLDATAPEDVVDDKEISIEPVNLVKAAIQKVFF
jgi:hypothetical protein